MPHLHKQKHPDISRRNALVCQAWLKTGENRQQIADKFNLSVWRITQIVAEYEAYRPNTRRFPYKFIGKKNYSRLRRLWTAGLSRVEISQLLNINISQVRRIARKLGLPKRPPAFGRKRRNQARRKKQ